MWTQGKYGKPLNPGPCDADGYEDWEEAVLETTLAASEMEAGSLDTSAPCGESVAGKNQRKLN